jgi:hypothetical protein
MTIGRRRAFYRVRNNFYGWAKLAAAASILGFLGLRLLHQL